MAVRWYLSPVAWIPERDGGRDPDDGVPMVLGPENIVKARAVLQVPPRVPAQVITPMIPRGPDGKTTVAWCLCRVDAADHTRLLADPEIVAFPVRALTETLSAQERNALRTKLQEKGLPVPATVRTLRQAVWKILTMQHPSITDLPRFHFGVEAIDADPV